MWSDREFDSMMRSLPSFVSESVVEAMIEKDELERAEIKTCKYCGREALEWAHTSSGWRLADIFTGDIHSCDAHPSTEYSRITAALETIQEAVKENKISVVVSWGAEGADTALVAHRVDNGKVLCSVPVQLGNKESQ